MNFNQRKNGCVPTLQCLQREFLEPLTFKEWCNQASNVYIGKNLSKYLHQPYPPVNYGDWYLNRVEYRYRIGEINQNEYNNIYEMFYRTHKWDELETLFGKCLGCWCRPDQDLCHGHILQKLCREKLLEKRMTQKDEEVGPMLKRNNAVIDGKKMFDCNNNDLCGNN